MYWKVIILNRISVYTPEEKRYKALVEALSANPECTQYGIQLEKLDSDFWLEESFPRIILVDILAWRDFPPIARAYQQLSNPPYLVLFHYRDTIQLTITDDIFIFGMSLDMTGDFFARLPEILKVKEDLPYYTVRIHKKLYDVRISDILYLEMDKHCVKVHTKDSTVKSWGTLEQEMERLRPYGFTRIHKSYVVNMRYIRKSTSLCVELTGGIILPIGRKYKSTYYAEYEYFLNTNNME